MLFAASKADGAIKTFGWVLAIWLFVIAAFIPLAGAYVTLRSLGWAMMVKGERYKEPVALAA